MLVALHQFGMVQPARLVVGGYCDASGLVFMGFLEPKHAEVDIDSIDSTAPSHQSEKVHQHVLFFSARLCA